MIRHPSRENLGVFAAVLAFSYQPVTLAQQQRTSSEAGPGLEEIIVTARKREEALQDVPLSVTALSSQKIADLRITSPDDIARFTPGFSYVSSFGRLNQERPTMRGQTNILGAANASFFVDGVYVSGPSVSTETSNLERIEVIKGPQAALYGRATFAGAINYVTKRPTDERTGKVSLAAGQHGEREISGFASGPLVSERLFYYAGARYWNYEGDYTNVVDGRPAGAQKTISGTLKLLWTPAENFEATLLATKSQDDDEGALALGLQGREFNNCQLRVISGTAANNFAGTVLPRSPGYYCGTVLGASDLPVQQRIDVMTDPGLDRDSLRLALTTNTTFAGGYTLTTVSAYHDEDQESQIDVSYAAYDPFVQTVNAAQAGAFWRQGAEEREDFAQELRLDSPQDRRLRWRVGGYYFKGNDDTLKDNKYTPVGFAVTPSPANACVALPRGNFLCPNGQATLAERSIENRAVFGDIEFDFTDQWTVTAEVRRAKEEAEQLNQNVLPPFCNPAIATNTPGLTINGCRFAGEWTSTTPRFTLRYKMTPDATFYFNAAKGNKPGGFNSASAVQVGINTGVLVKAAYDEEESKAYELGAKLNLLDGRASFNVAAFFTDLTGQQLTSNIVGILNGNAVLNSFIANIGATEIKGVEIESALQITPAWDAQLTLSYVNSKVTEFFDNNQVALTSPSGPFQTTPSALGPVTLCNQRTGTQVPGRPFCDDAIAADLATYGDVAGAYSPRTPKVQASLSSSYKGEFDNGLTWRLSGDVSYEGSKYGQVDNFSKTGAHTYVGLRYGLSSESWDLTLWGKNIFDDDTALDILRYIDTRGITAAQFSTPALGRITPRGFVLTYPRSRQFGATLSFKF